MKTRWAGPAQVVVAGALIAVAGTGCTHSSPASPAAGGPARASLAGSTTPSTPASTTPSTPASSAPGTPASGSSAAGSGQPAAPAAGTPATPPTGSPAATGGVHNLAVTAGVRQELLTAYVDYRNIPAADVGPAAKGTLYYAYDPASGTYWAMATYPSVPSDPISVQVGFQDGGAEGLYRKSGSGPWKVSQGGEPTLCGELQWFPAAVMRAWSLPTAPLPGMQC